ncbi:glycogen/starch/alpha-glucan phosphorylase [bacterium]|nr:glycogen/starch/alpha-glucan phosphorylase [bacterium]
MTAKGTSALVEQMILDHLCYTQAKDQYSATERDRYVSVAMAARNFIAERWIRTQQKYYEVDAKRIYYLSLEFLLGRLLMNNILNLGLEREFEQTLTKLELDRQQIIDLEWDAGLGNGGLGRLAACFLDSMASLGYPGYGYGIRYEYGIFFQRILDGHQVETPDNWLRYGNVWELARPEILYMVSFYGKVNSSVSRNDRLRMEWVNSENVMAMAYDYPVVGYHNNVVNTLRLWSAKSTREFNLDYFNSGDYVRAVDDKSRTESISKVLYPNDQSLAGKELRLKQQYFFVSATLKDIIRRYRKFHKDFNEFPDKVAIQLNDTHPSIAIPELMRILVDEHNFEWDEAWSITTRSFSYTNHTILPEALEMWSEDIIGNLLPRHLQIIQEINRRLLVQISYRFPNEPARKENQAIITRHGRGLVHMSRLAITGSHTVNGVSALHSAILQQSVFPDFQQMWPDKFTNVTNGVTPRRWVLEANPSLSTLITDSIGTGWLKDLTRLRELEPFAIDPVFIEQFQQIKKMNKEKFSDYLKKTVDILVNPDFMFDCQAKRFHEYKRQLLNILHAITLYNRVLENRPEYESVPRAIIFAGKSAPGYFMSKLIIKLIHCVADIVQAHPKVREKLQIVFAPNYTVSLAQILIPAADLSEQISTAGYEASGTGNMKFALNGALTIGTLDGANVEIREEVGPDNFFLFGLNAQEIRDYRPHYNPVDILEQNEQLSQIINQLSDGYFSPGAPDLFHPIVNTLLGDGDRYFVLADYQAYIDCQDRVAAMYLNRKDWNRMAVLNVARCGKFSSDRAIQEYAQNIWRAKQVQQDT